MTSAINASVGGIQVIATPNSRANNGVCKIVDHMWSSTKNVADLFGLLSKGAKFAGPLVPESVTPWTEHMEKAAGQARGMLSIPYLLTVVNKFFENRNVRNGVEVCKISGFATSAIVPDPAMAGTIAKGAGVFGVTLDAIDLSQELDMHSACANLANVRMTPDVRKIVDNQLWTSALKIFKLALTLFVGIVATGAWILSLAIPAPLAAAALVSSLAALMISFYLGYSENTAQWTAKVSLLPVANPV